MDLCVVGAGYVGLTTSAVLAELGHFVTCTDVDQKKISLLKNGFSPVYEPGLDPLIRKGMQSGRLAFSENVSDEPGRHPVIFIAVGTPALEDGQTDLSSVGQVAKTLAPSINEHKTIVIKSTVPPRTSEWLAHILQEEGVRACLFDLVSNPEFLREGSAVHDALHPDKIVVGTSSRTAGDVVASLYKGIDAPIIETDPVGAELIKYASNAFLATKISFMNEMARICDRYGANVTTIRDALATDPRIGAHFLNAGLGFGGSCLPKDLMSLVHTAKKAGVEPELTEAVLRVNSAQIDMYVNKLKTRLPDLTGKHIAVWGVTFKADTDDTRASQSIELIRRLKKEGCQVHTYDPKVRFDEEGITAHQHLYDAVGNADALLIATEWAAFKKADWSIIKGRMRGRVVLDCRNAIDPETIRAHQLIYLGLGRS